MTRRPDCRTLLVLFLLALLPGLGGAGELKPYTGDPLPDFSLPGLDGKTHRLQDYRGKVVLVNFWATWCPPCVHEMPSMERLQTKMAGKPFAILAVNMGESEPEIREFLQKMQVSFPIVMDSDGEVLRSWKIFAFPTTFLIAPDGRVTHGLFGGLEWDSPEAVAVVESLLP